jgi:hypothetical protein
MWSSSLTSMLHLAFLAIWGSALKTEGNTWDEFIGSVAEYNMVKTYIGLKVRMLFDPPGTSFHIAAMEKQIEEYEWRISTHREWLRNPVDPLTVIEEVI